MRTALKAAHRRAAVRRSTLRAFALYPSHWRATSNMRTQPNPIAVPGGGPSMRGGPTALDSARGNVGVAQGARFANFGSFPTADLQAES